ncbi:glycosyltransferase family 2 protein [Natrialba sp. SSL1]|uniref:glycosyltransferase family 2 protein n=1 Tax=Natrialba sp. SSL1 TaxID=1869245 RepID=UPI0009FF0F19|nr:glycosyltransferase family 2 protein [Natrialba sp. SSL1]
MSIVLEFVLLMSIFGLVHTYFLYPVLLFIVDVFIRGEKGRGPTGELPKIALVIAAYNEEEVIGEKIENSLRLDYPEEKIEIVVFSDGSTDNTDKIVKSYEEERVHLERIEGRVGKTECQNRVVSKTKNDVEYIVFSDANSMYHRNAINKLMEKFGDNIGCVVGELRYRDSSDIEGESFYWRYENIIKRFESRVNSLVTGNGSIYAVKKSSYTPLPRGAISDFAEPLAIIHKGEKVKYAPDAIAWEDTAGSMESEMDRRARIVTRSWNTISNYLNLLNPIQFPIFSFQIFSHKILRWLSPVFLLLALLSNLIIVLFYNSLFYELLLLSQLIFYMLALTGFAYGKKYSSPPLIFHIPYYFLISNYGLLIGLWNFIHGQNIITWETEDR